MVKIVVPLGIDSVAADPWRVDHSGIIQIALGDKPRVAPEQVCLLMKGLCQLAEHMNRTEVEDLVNCVEPQRVDMILSQPVQSIVDEESPDAIALRTVEIDCRAPRRSIAVGKVWAVLAKIISFRAQMI